MKRILFFLFFNSFHLFINNSKINNDITSNKNFETYNYRNINNKLAKKNIILGTIVGYSLKSVSPFFNSLIHSNLTNCDVVIFIKNITRKLKNYLKNIGVILVPISNEYNNIPITKSRWKLYFDYLKKRKNKYNQVFTTDIRDVIFQKDIFKYYEKYKSFLGFALEDKFLNETTNKQWIVNYVGNEIYKKIQNERIICFGSIWGSIDKILEFSGMFWEKVLFNKNSTDQGIGNYLIYYEKIFHDCILYSDNFGPVITIGWSQPNDIHLDLNDNILNLKGELASVIHQYDRNIILIKKINNKFLYNNYKRNSIKNSMRVLLFLILFKFSMMKIIQINIEIGKLILFYVMIKNKNIN